MLNVRCQGCYVLKLEWMVNRQYDSQLHNLCQKSGQLKDECSLFIILHKNDILLKWLSKIFLMKLNFSNRNFKLLILLGSFTWFCFNGKKNLIESFTAPVPKWAFVKWVCNYYACVTLLIIVIDISTPVTFSKYQSMVGVELQVSHDLGS